MNATQDLTIRVQSAMGDIPADAWDACANPNTGSHNPFLSHAFLHALETSGCVRAETGWLPQHLIVQDSTDDVIGAMPLYLKSHSQGEYVFDAGWAHAYEDAGGSYYPKLQSSVPFTPVTGRRLLAAPGTDEEAIEAALLGGAIELVRLHEASSLHVTFLPEESWSRHGT